MGSKKFNLMRKREAARPNDPIQSQIITMTPFQIIKGKNRYRNLRNQIHGRKIYNILRDSVKFKSERRKGGSGIGIEIGGGRKDCLVSPKRNWGRRRWGCLRVCDTADPCAISVFTIIHQKKVTYFYLFFTPFFFIKKFNR